MVVTGQKKRAKKSGAYLVERRGGKKTGLNVRRCPKKKVEKGGLFSGGKGKKKGGERPIASANALTIPEVEKGKGVYYHRKEKKKKKKSGWFGLCGVGGVGWGGGREEGGNDNFSSQRREEKKVFLERMRRGSREGGELSSRIKLGKGEKPSNHMRKKRGGEKVLFLRIEREKGGKKGGGGGICRLSVAEKKREERFAGSEWKQKTRGKKKKGERDSFL